MSIDACRLSEGFKEPRLLLYVPTEPSLIEGYSAAWTGSEGVMAIILKRGANPSIDVDFLCTRGRSASVLLSNGAIWDVDFSKWRIYLQRIEPEFSSRHAHTLGRIQGDLERKKQMEHRPSSI